MTRPKLINGDVRQVLSELEPESVQCVVTSPPYWGLRDYGSDGQLGLEATPDGYIDNMVEVFRKVKRVLRKDGTVWLNIGDNYFGGGRGEDRKYKEAYDSVENSKPDWKKIKGLKPKDLVGIPWRLALALQADGWWLRNDIIWSKPNPMPDRLTKSHEYIFLLTKSKTYYYDHESIKEPYSESSIQRINQSTFDTQKGGSKDYGKVSVHSKNTNSIRGTLEKFKENLGTGRNRRTVWEIVTRSYPEAHFATFPEEIPELCIKAGTKAGDLVLDPFVGSGTTCAVASRLGRESIGIDLSEEYLKLARKRCKIESESLLSYV
jgi:DNA modification methylase